MSPTINGVTLHEGKPAVNVKVRATRSTFESYAPGFERAADELGDERVQMIEEGVQAQFWNADAQSISKEYGYGEVWSEGRSSGWLIVDKPPELEDDPYYLECEECGHEILEPYGDGERFEKCAECGHVQTRETFANAQRWLEFAGRIAALVNWSEREFARRVVAVAERERSKQTYLVALVVPIRGIDPTEAWEDFTDEAERMGALFCGSPLRADENDIDDPDFDVIVRSHGRALKYAEYAEYAEDEDN